MTQEQNKMLEDLTKTVSEIKTAQDKRDKMFEDLSKTVGEIKETQDDMKLELERQRKNMAAMEFNLSEKIDALFDAREMSLEKAEKHDKKFKSMENILERHGLRISILESKLS